MVDSLARPLIPPSLFTADKLPMRRGFLEFPVQDLPPGILCTDLRVLQLNMLADGLSGLRDDRGFFSRVSRKAISWDYRKDLLLHEITQYSPDIITLQENDHYYDFFLPELDAMGYDCFFAPKPASACLEVSDRSDGCSMFFRRDKIKVLSSETVTYVLSSSDVENELSSINTYAQVTEERRKKLRAQNQVAMINVCELQGEFMTNVPPLVVGTTHLKATKNTEGERFRQREAAQFLDTVDKVCKGLKDRERTPAVILTGDFNSLPSGGKYPALAYETIKAHELGLRSVLNDDVGYSRPEGTQEIYTTWKARSRKGKENIVKHCIDYIFYSPFRGRSEKKVPTAPTSPFWPAFVREGIALNTTRDTSNDGLLRSESAKQISGFRVKSVLDLFDEGNERNA